MFNEVLQLVKTLGVNTATGYLPESTIPLPAFVLNEISTNYNTRLLTGDTNGFTGVYRLELIVDKTDYINGINTLLALVNTLDNVKTSKLQRVMIEYDHTQALDPLVPYARAFVNITVR